MTNRMIYAAIDAVIDSPLLAGLVGRRRSDRDRIIGRMVYAAIDAVIDSALLALVGSRFRPQGTR